MNDMTDSLVYCIATSKLYGLSDKNIPGKNVKVKPDKERDIRFTLQEF